VQAIEKSGYRPQIEIDIGIDCAASYLYHNNHYLVNKKRGGDETRSSLQQIQYLEDLCKKYPAVHILEDPLSDEDWLGWQQLSQQLFQKEMQIVGDDLFVTHVDLLKKGIYKGIANHILIKPNQVGTLTETLQTIQTARQYKYHTIISHRSGETEDVTISDLAVGCNAHQIKAGSLSRSERTAKYNRLLYLEKILKS